MPHCAKIAVTGGLGFIGVNCLRYWIERAMCPYFVLIDDTSVGTTADLEAGLGDLGELNRRKSAGVTTWLLEREGQETVRIAWHMRDISHPGVEPILQGARAVVHLAGQTGVIPSVADPMRDMRSNILGSLNLLEACRGAGVERFVFASSSAPLGAALPPVSEGSLPRPLSPYGASKLAVEAYLSAYHATYGLKTTALRFSNVYGPRSGRKGSVVALFMRNILAGQPLVIYGDGEQTRDFLYIDDICEAVTLALGTESESVLGGPAHIATGVETTVNELVDRLAALAEADGLGPLDVRREDARAGEMTRSFSDISLAREALGYAPRWDLEHGLPETWEWFKHAFHAKGGA